MKKVFCALLAALTLLSAAVVPAYAVDSSNCLLYTSPSPRDTR